MTLRGVSSNSVECISRSLEPSVSRRNGDCAASRKLSPSSGVENMQSASPIFQSMLRNTTELGDSALFAIKPSRMSRGISYKWNGSSPSVASLKPRSSAASLPSRNSRQEHRTSIFTRPSMSRKSSVPYVKSQGPPRPTSAQQKHISFGSNSFEQSTRTDLTFLDHRSYASLKSNADSLLAVRPRSPFVYPTRLKRPGYRPTSPALSDSGGYHCRSTIGVARGISYRATSPSSVYSQYREPSAYRSDFNHSVPSLRHHSSLPSRSRFRTQPTFRQPMPPSSIKQYNSVSSTFDNGTRPTNDMGSGRASSTMYYDYTEAFGEDEDSDKARAVPSWPLTSVDAANLRARPSGVNVDPDALLRGAEASDTLRNKSDEDDTAIDLVYHGKSDAVDLAKKFLKSANPLCSAPGNDDAFAEEKHDSPKEIPKQNIKPAQSSVGRSEKNSSRDVPRGSSSSPSTFPTRRLSFTDSNRSGDDLSFSSAFISSPNLPRLSALSKDQVILWEDHMRAFTPSSFNDSKTPSLPQWIIPSMKFSHLDLAGRLEDTQSPAGVPRTDSTEIHSPVPERPLTSRSHNQKFASLISIDQGLAELKDVITTFEAAERPYTPDDFISESNRSSVYFPYRTSSRLSKSAPRTVDLFDESVQKDVVESQPPKTAEESMNTVDQISSDRSGNVSPREDLDKHGTLDELQVTKYPSHPRANSSEPLSPRRVSAESQNAKARDSVASSYIRRLSSSLSPPAHLVDNIAAHIRPRKSSVTATPTSPYPDNAAAVDDNPETSHKISRASKDGLTHTATDPPQVQPRNSSLGAVSPLSQNGTVASNLMHISSDAKLTKEISILPNAESFKAFTPPISHRRSRLPFSFAPLLSENGLEIAGIEAPIVDNYKRLEDTSGEGRPMQRRFKVKLRSTRPILSTSPPDSRPWNLDESYPWANNTSSIEMNIPPPTAPVAHRNHPSQSPSKFKVKVPRSSASPTGTVKVNKKRVAAGSSPPISASINLFSSGKNANASSGFFGSLGRKLGHGSRIRVSEDGGSSAVHSESRPPTIQLAIPSPTLNRSEVQSFFSDDSSFKRNRGSVRQRLSQFKARLPASRKNSTEDLRDPEKIFFMSMPRRSRSDGRLSEDDGEEIVGMSNVEYRVRKLVEVVKNWVQKAKNINGKYSGTKFYAGHETGNLGASV